MTAVRVVWLNGEMVAGEQATVPLLSHSFSRGSAIFESFGVHESAKGPAVFRMDEHLKRLQRSADLLGMELAYSAEQIAEAVAQTVRANDTGRGLIKVMAYWGEEAVVEMVPDVPLDLAVFSINNGGELHLDDASGITACLSKWRKLHPETVAVEAKATGNYLSGYLARKDARDRGFDVGFLLSTDGFLAEGSTESVFIVKDGVLLTPPLGRILSGISRMSVLEVAKTVGLPAREETLRAEDLYAADEIFTAHSGVKVHPVARFEERDLAAPGPLTQQLMQLMDDMLNFRDERFAHFFQYL
jgi:branched-chain amino acid aminotransferase